MKNVGFWRRKLVKNCQPKVGIMDSGLDIKLYGLMVKNYFVFLQMEN